MRIIISGKIKRLDKKETDDLIRKYLRFSLEKTFDVDKKALKETTVYVSILSDPKITGAYVGPIDEQPHRYFDLTMTNDVNRGELEEYCFHESIHIWQYLRGDLSDSVSQDHVLWKRRKHKWVETGTFEYHMTPWEQEAYSLTRYLQWEYK